ncbi:MAG: DUF2285 domain-containing protein [Rhizobiales bacterium]|nr:DUF2285 domain-containing protein [Hyphomicrobiales bacterium]
MPEDDTSALLLAPAPATFAVSAEPTAPIAAAAHVGSDGEDVLLFDLGNGQRLQLDVEAGVRFGEPLAAIIPLDRAGFDRLEALTRLLASLHGRSIPPDTRLTAQQRLRLRRMLQCFDGYRDGATQREIAQIVFRLARQDRQQWQDASARHAIKALLRDARAMIAGGYRALLRHRRQG